MSVGVDARRLGELVHSWRSMARTLRSRAESSPAIRLVLLAEADTFEVAADGLEALAVEAGASSSPGRQAGVVDDQVELVGGGSLLEVSGSVLRVRSWWSASWCSRVAPLLVMSHASRVSLSRVCEVRRHRAGVVRSLRCVVFARAQRACACASSERWRVRVSHVRAASGIGCGARACCARAFASFACESRSVRRMPVRFPLCAPWFVPGAFFSPLRGSGLARLVLVLVRPFRPFSPLRGSGLARRALVRFYAARWAALLVVLSWSRMVPRQGVPVRV